jgi:DNA-binding NarL/FixJ family response regulator
LGSLSRKEREILICIAKGYNNQEIADRTYMAEQTVRNYVSRIYAKLNLKDRSHAMKEAISRGLDRMEISDR